jgi:RimJ/RimL family protein N-acetyltransferase
MTLEAVLETDRLRLTNWLPEHLHDVERLHGDPEVTRYLNSDGQPESRERVQERLDEWAGQFATRRMGKLRVTRKADGELLGRAGFGIYPPTGEPEIGYALFCKHWGNGYAFEAASGLRDWIFRETEEPHFIGFADRRNIGSLKVLTSIGMRFTHEEQDVQGLYCRFHIFTRED